MKWILLRKLISQEQPTLQTLPTYPNKLLFAYYLSTSEKKKKNLCIKYGGGDAKKWIGIDVSLMKWILMRKLISQKQPTLQRLPTYLI